MILSDSTWRIKSKPKVKGFVTIKKYKFIKILSEINKQKIQNIV